MIAAQVKPDKAASNWRKMFRRVAVILLVTVIAGFTVRHASVIVERNKSPAGFGRGMIQGILMPCALPYLLVGNDVSIYNQNNTGISYKLGYTCGVNACGAVFFGIFFWRLNRWRKSLKA